MATLPQQRGEDDIAAPLFATDSDDDADYVRTRAAAMTNPSPFASSSSAARSPGGACAIEVHGSTGPSPDLKLVDHLLQPAWFGMRRAEYDPGTQQVGMVVVKPAPAVDDG